MVTTVFGGVCWFEEKRKGGEEEGERRWPNREEAARV
jgi:hypothetical protein